MSLALEMLLHKVNKRTALAHLLTEESLHTILEALQLSDEDAMRLKLIGEGTQALVFWLPDKTRILKLTRDTGDAEVAAMLKGKRMKHLLHVYDVFELSPKNRVVYGIVAEKLTPLSGADRTTWNAGLNNLRNFKDRFDGHSLWWHLRHSGLVPSWIETIQDTLSHLPDDTDPKAQAALEEILPLWTEMAEEMYDIRASGYWDMHDRNVMMRGRQVVLVDFGSAIVMSPAPIHRLKSR